jgi:hypothetical protein
MENETSKSKGDNKNVQKSKSSPYTVYLGFGAVSNECYEEQRCLSLLGLVDTMETMLESQLLVLGWVKRFG